MIHPQVLTIGSTSPAPEIGPEKEVVTVFNSDATNPLMISDTQSIIIDDPNVIPLSPGQSITFDGSRSWYGLSPPGTEVAIYQMPGVRDFRLGGTSPAITPPSVFTANAGSGVAVDLVGGTGFPNPKSLPVQVRRLAISSTASGTISTGFSAIDQVFDPVSLAPLLFCDISLGIDPAGTGQSNSNGVSMDMDNIVVESGRIRLSNGGGSAAFRTCSATIIFFLVNNVT